MQRRGMCLPRDVALCAAGVTQLRRQAVFCQTASYLASLRRAAGRSRRGTSRRPLRRGFGCSSPCSSCIGSGTLVVDAWRALPPAGTATTRCAVAARRLEQASGYEPALGVGGPQSGTPRDAPLRRSQVTTYASAASSFLTRVDSKRRCPFAAAPCSAPIPSTPRQWRRSRQGRSGARACASAGACCTRASAAALPSPGRLRSGAGGPARRAVAVAGCGRTRHASGMGAAAARRGARVVHATAAAAAARCAVRGRVRRAESRWAGARGRPRARPPQAHLLCKEACHRAATLGQRPRRGGVALPEVSTLWGRRPGAGDRGTKARGAAAKGGRRPGSQLQPEGAPPPLSCRHTLKLRYFAQRERSPSSTSCVASRRAAVRRVVEPCGVASCSVSSATSAPPLAVTPAAASATAAATAPAISVSASPATSSASQPRGPTSISASRHGASASASSAAVAAGSSATSAASAASAASASVASVNSDASDAGAAATLSGDALSADALSADALSVATTATAATATDADSADMAPSTAAHATAAMASATAVATPLGSIFISAPLRSVTSSNAGSTTGSAASSATVADAATAAATATAAVAAGADAAAADAGVTAADEEGVVGAPTTHTRQAYASYGGGSAKLTAPARPHGWKRNISAVSRSAASVDGSSNDAGEAWPPELDRSRLRGLTPSSEAVEAPSREPALFILTHPNQVGSLDGASSRLGLKLGLLRARLSSGVATTKSRKSANVPRRCAALPTSSGSSMHTCDSGKPAGLRVAAGVYVGLASWRVVGLGSAV
eukprot:scaffold8290_cov62-Phaeocystis_antarctica.AAC.1